MGMGNALTTACVLDAFSDEVETRGGTVTDAFNDSERLFVRSVLPQLADVKAGDRLQGGVALKAREGDVWVHPYVFRLVCKNGAIMAQAVASRHVLAGFDWNQEEAVSNVREAVRVCCESEVFMTSSQQIRSVRDVEADFAINMLPMLTQMRGSVGTRLVQQILQRFFEDGDRTQFGLMNAVTSVARDTADPQVRWDLEELGGGIPVLRPAPIPRMPRHARRARRAALVS